MQSSHGSLKSTAPGSSGWSIRLVAPSNSSLLGRFSPSHRAMSSVVHLLLGFNPLHLARWSGHTQRHPAIPCLPPWICLPQYLRDSLPNLEHTETRLVRSPWSLHGVYMRGIGRTPDSDRKFSTLGNRDHAWPHRLEPGQDSQLLYDIIGTVNESSMPPTYLWSCTCPFLLPSPMFSALPVNASEVTGGREWRS